MFCLDLVLRLSLEASQFPLSNVLSQHPNLFPLDSHSPGHDAPTLSAPGAMYQITRDSPYALEHVKFYSDLLIHRDSGKPANPGCLPYISCPYSLGVQIPSCKLGWPNVATPPYHLWVLHSTGSQLCSLLLSVVLVHDILPSRN